MRTDVCRQIRHVAFALLGLMVILIVYVSYLQVIESALLTGHPLNRRSVEIARRVERGQIFDRHGKVLAKSERDAEGIYRRHYFYAEAFAHVIGYDSGRYGKAGVEGSFNGHLSGLINSGGLGAITKLWPPKAGNNLHLTLDVRLQQVAYEALGSYRGSIVALNPATGEILAMVSKPSFNPNRLEEDWDTLVNNSNSPLFNRATQGLYPPGSTAKVITAESALKERIVQPNTIFDCNGTLPLGSDYVLREAGQVAHGKVNLIQALAVSCNITFGQLALDLGRAKLAKAYERYGFDQMLPDFELPETRPQLPDFSSLTDGEVAQVGIGQGVLVTPLRMALTAAAIANNGVIMKPYIVMQITAPEGNIVEQFRPQPWLKPVSSQQAAQIKEAMVKTVSFGTGRAVRITGIQVAGKTGSAENPQGDTHAWFIGFAPAEKPEIAVAVIVENAGSGGSVAAPIARKVMAAALR